MFNKIRIIIITIIVLTFTFLDVVFSETASDIKEQIENQDQEIEKLEKAILESQKKVEQYSVKSVSLKKEIANLNYLNSKLKKSIYKKEQDIKKINESIKIISNNIDKNTGEIENLKKRIRFSIFIVNQIYIESLFESVLSGKTLSAISTEENRIKSIQKNIKKNIESFSSVSKRLLENKNKKEKENEKLDLEKDNLSDKKIILNKNTKDKNYILNITKNKESNYKKLLAEQKREKEEFEEQLFELESKLEFVLKKELVPKPKIGLFVWPTPTYPTNYHWITQFFGLTTFREVHYNGKGHNGIDIGVPTGTELYSVMSGTVLDVGDTTKICRGVQYGKWITVDHGNGLTSMYAHLSLIKVKKGDKVKRGQKIGLTGNTGYSTGAHLHFTVYYSDGLEIKTITHSFAGSKCYGKKFKLPIASHNAYTDPFDYLPKPEFTKIKAVKFGDKSSYVKELQNMLKYEKVFPRDVSANGYYGDITQKSVAEWKEKYNISGNAKTFSNLDVKKFKENY